MKERKSSLRKKLLLKREEHDSQERFAFEDSIVHNCIEFCKNWSQPGDFICSYRPIKGEVNLDPLFNLKQYNWVYPKVEGESLVFYHCKSFEDFMEGSFNIPEPIKGLDKINLHDCSIVFVPGVAFDRRGRRLGMGKGFYDRALENQKIIKAGVSFSFQLLNEELPFESHDLNMDFIITEKFIFTPINLKRMS